MAVQESADLVVVGAGTIGGWAATFAAEAGLKRVVVLERGLVGGGASSRAAGHRAGPGRNAGHGGPGPLDDRLLPRPAGPLRDRFRLPRAWLPDPGGDRPGRARRPGPGRDAAPGGARRELAERRRGPRGQPDPGRRAGHRGGSYAFTDGAIDPPRNVLAYSLAMQRPASSSASGPRSQGLRVEHGRVVGRRDVRRPDRDGAGPAHRRADPALGGQAGRAADRGRRRPPPDRRDRAVTRPSRSSASRWSSTSAGPLLAARGGRPAVRDEQPRTRSRASPARSTGRTCAGCSAGSNGWCRRFGASACARRGARRSTSPRTTTRSSGPAITPAGDRIDGVTVASPGGHGMMWGPAVARVGADLASPAGPTCSGRDARASASIASTPTRPQPAAPPTRSTRCPSR
jgi:sarcosine oxidase subunit beta